MFAAIDSKARHPVPSDAALVCMQQLIQARHHVPSDSAAVRAAIDAKRGIISHAILLPSAQPLILKRGIPCHAMLHCMQYLIRARHHVPSDAAAVRAAIDAKRGIISHAILLPCAQPLILKRGIQCHAMLHCMQHLIRARHHMPGGAAVTRAAIESKRSITCQAMLLSSAQP